ncbi:hypothetical protein [Aliivibrio sifiae]|uniref:Uncharacterized protein n=1 Tax=Aliivibrio sifiae TaxID=566293 RepID=A0A2S7X7U7_9GAMM|nr:hypothetical protein [Aliivibrio sifiae]PQJ87419.1 hypothetical protein BTO23_14995 [Aliivibrio sifiae]GLR77180.1 hypothetical protein GCM10007855_40550 [Aliivibrio sifiae]
MENYNTAAKFQMHYYFEDKSHSMDAFVRNKCESEILAIITEIAKTLNVKIQIESEVRKEGGLREIWAFTNANAGVLSVIIGIAALVSSRIPVGDSELEDLQKQDLKLSIQERQLRINKLKAEIKDDVITAETVGKVADLVSKDNKIIIRKSNLYKSLDTYRKVSKIGVNGLDLSDKEVSAELIVKRPDFKKFIVKSNVLPVETIEDAVIEIVSPVLKSGNYKWKGIFEGESINFSMTDKSFQLDVLSEKISFQHGSMIKCTLLIHSKIDEVGEVVITGYSVDTVLENMEGHSFVETKQGKSYRNQKALKAAQGDLFAGL